MKFSELKLDGAHVKSFNEAHHSITLFTRGIKPTYKNKNGYTVIPHNYKSEYDKYFEDILYRHPNEDEVTHQWRRATLPIGKAQEPLVNSINRLVSVMFSEDNFTFSSQDELTATYFKDIKQLFKEKYTNRVEDPNGLLAVIDLHEKAFINDRPRPGIIYVESENIKYQGQDMVVFKYKEHYHVLTPTSYARYKEENEQFVFGYFHEVGIMPVITLGGNKVGNHFISDFAFYIDWAKDFLQQSSDDRAILKNAAYPIPVMAKETCEKCGGAKTVAVDSCKGATCEICHGAGCRKTCTTCGGEGQIKYFPGRVINFNPTTAGEGGGLVKAGDLMNWATPSLEPATHSLERIKYEKEGGEKALNIRNVNAQQSGEAKALDMAYEEANIKQISDSFFTVCSYILEVAVKWLNYKREVQYSVSKPVTFELKTPLEITSDYEMLVKINASKGVLDTAKMRVLKSLYPNDKLLLRKEKAMMYIDTLYHDSAQAIATKELAGLITNEQSILHETLNTIMTEYIDRIGVEAFMMLSDQEIKKAVIVS